MWAIWRGSAFESWSATYKERQKSENSSVSCLFFLTHRSPAKSAVGGRFNRMTTALLQAHEITLYSPYNKLELSVWMQTPWTGHVLLFCVKGKIYGMIGWSFSIAWKWGEALLWDLSQWVASPWGLRCTYAWSYWSYNFLREASLKTRLQESPVCCSCACFHIFPTYFIRQFCAIFSVWLCNLQKAGWFFIDFAKVRMNSQKAVKFHHKQQFNIFFLKQGYYRLGSSQFYVGCVLFQHGVSRF